MAEQYPAREPGLLGPLPADPLITLTTLIALVALIALILRGLNRDDLGNCLHKIIHRRHGTLRKRELDLPVVADLISRRVMERDR